MLSNKLLYIFLCTLLCSGCMKKTDMYGPGGEDGGNGNGSGNTVRSISVQYLKSLYANYPLAITENLEVNGLIVANDRFGTFDNTIVVQDASGGIEIKVSGRELYTDLPVGQEVRVSCKGLVLGGYGGVVQLGTPSDNPDYQTSFIPASLIQSHIILIDKPITYALPTPLSIDRIEPRHVSSFVQFSDVQFVEEEVGAFWCEVESEGENEADALYPIDTDRHITDRQGNVMIVRTSRNARFAKNKLPDGNGQIEGILSYFNGKYQLKVYSGINVVMKGPRFVPVNEP